MLARTCVETARFELQNTRFSLYFLHKDKWNVSSLRERLKSSVRARSFMRFLCVRHRGLRWTADHSVTSE